MTDIYDPFEAAGPEAPVEAPIETRPKKRKASPADDGARRRLRPPSPWGEHDSLTAELRAFADYVAVSSEERRARQDLRRRVAAAARALWPQSSVDAFGSSSTALDWFESDVDLRVSVNKPMTYLSPARACIDLAQELFDNHVWATDLDSRPHARIPVVALIDSRTGVAVDVSFDDGEALSSARAACPAGLAEVHRDVSLFLKAFLKHRDLDKPFTGGLGSFRLCVLVAWHLDRNESQASAGDALVAFLAYAQHHDFARQLPAGGKHVSFHGLDVPGLVDAFRSAHAALKNRAPLAHCLDVRKLEEKREAKVVLARSFCSRQRTAAIPPPASYAPTPRANDSDDDVEKEESLAME
ncbi:hypothetical protein M885DRAFT_591544 [Pelagophyceae sp. CCMP2097]|nr:hypothetical protein M885DRAFT_591544 [Pelagophyceae sp. CCMP2097]